MKDWLDKQLTDGLSDYSSQADFEGLWGKIEQKRKKKDRRWIFFLLFFGLGLAAAGGGYWLQTQEAVILSEEINTSIIQNEAPLNPTTMDTNAALAATNTTTTETITTIQGTTPSVKNPNISAPFSASPRKTKIQNPLIAQSSPKQQARTPINKKNPISHTSKQQQAITKLPTPLQQKLGMTGWLQSKTMTAQVEKQELFNYHLISPNQPNQKRGFWLSLDLYYGLHDQNRKLIDAEQSNYLTRFNAAEQTVDAMGLQLSLKKYIHPKFFLQTGLGYTLLTDRFEDSYSNTFTSTLENEVIKIIYSPDGTFEEVFGSTTIEINRQREKIAYKRSHFLHLPLLLGTDLELHKRWGLSLAAGLNYSYLLKQSGSSYDFSLEQGAYRPLSEKDYSSQHLWQAQAQAQLFYQLQQRLQLTAGLRGQLSLNGLKAPELGWREKWQMGTLRLGMQWRLR